MMRVASELGYLEADPTLDVEGYDAAQKATILASIAFHTEVPVDAVHREGRGVGTGHEVRHVDGRPRGPAVGRGRRSIP